MSYTLVLGDIAYSSWSLRAWLLFEKFDIPRTTQYVSFANEKSVAKQMPEMSPANTVPTIKTPDGAIVGDSLAIAEELAAATQILTSGPLTQRRAPQPAFWQQRCIRGLPPFGPPAR